MSDKTLTRRDADTPLLSGWGRVFEPGRELRTENLATATVGATLCRGLGRSYGDSSLPPPGQLDVVATPLADRILHFDAETGRLRAEAGLSLREMNRLLMGRGWFTPVTPGTQFVTLGGMVAADIHGKNHHVAGCFGEHVRQLKMRTADGQLLSCSPETHADLFDATLGGMGLTGHILEVEVQMERIPSPWLVQKTSRHEDIESFIDALKRAGDQWPYTVGWIDCLSSGPSMGRGLLFCGRWATAREAPSRPPIWKRALTMPVTPPNWLLNDTTMGLFNTAIYGRHGRRTRRGLVDPETFFYPLDSVRQWNRMYGSRGFTQYQCVLPESAGRGAARRFLEVLTSRGGASFLCVIKDCGEQGRGTLSFPMRGISIALDIPIRNDTQALVDALNEHVLHEGGRIYLAKDGFTRANHFQAMEGRLGKWLQVRDKWDPRRRIRSRQSVRILGDPSGEASGREGA